MFTGEILVAALLLTAPQTAEPDISWALVLRPNVIALAMDDEIVDDREKGYLMSQDAMGDLTMLQGRYKEFAGAPRVEEHTRFYDKHFVAELLGQNRACRNYWASRRAIDLCHEAEIDLLLQDIDRRYQVLDAVRDSAQDYYYVTVRRNSLALLRELIGDADFYSGRLISPVP